MSKTVLVVGTFDTKGSEHAFLREQILSQGCHVVTLDVGVVGAATEIPVDVSADEVARAAETDLETLRAANDRGAAMKCMAEGAAKVVRRMFDDGKFHGIIGMGGSGGSSILCQAMRGLPLGVPKVCVSTVAGSNTSEYVGTKDIVMFPSVTDIAGVHRFSKIVFTRAAGAICGMVRSAPAAATDNRRLIVASMFGNTTQCLDACRAGLDQAGYEVLVFHAIGTGGRTMEGMIDEGYAAACLDLTTTEWADEICHGIFSAGPDRLSAAGRAGIPHVIAPGCIDMVNYGPLSSVPQRYRDAGRLFYQWNPQVTLMRTNVEENEQLGRIFAAKANAARGPLAILLPLRGLSILGGEGERFFDPDADQAMFHSLRKHLRNDLEIHEIDANINDRAFSDFAVETTLRLLSWDGQPGSR